MRQRQAVRVLRGREAEARGVNVRQEALMLTTVTCHGCRETVSFCRELVYEWELACCSGSASVRQVRHQRLLCDAGGAWIRRGGPPSPRAHPLLVG